jgi:CelD/BcsL family acetyltransferase involved in cellulose biosynthesis
LARGLEVLVNLHQRRRESLGGRGCFASTRFATFHEETARRLLDSGNLRLVWLDVDGHTVAAEYQVLGDGVVYAYQSGIEPDSLEHEPGRLITMATLEQAVREGRRAFDFLRGDESYKAHWRAQPRATEDIRVVSATRTARLRHNLWLAGDNVKDWIKRSLKRSGVMSR